MLRAPEAEYGTPDQCEQLGLLLAGQAVNLAMQMYGCRVVQKALEYVNTERLMALVSEFESSCTSSLRSRPERQPRNPEMH